MSGRYSRWARTPNAAAAATPNPTAAPVILSNPCRSFALDFCDLYAVDSVCPSVGRKNLGFCNRSGRALESHCGKRSWPVQMAPGDKTVGPTPRRNDMYGPASFEAKPQRSQRDQRMTTPTVGQRVKVHYTDQLPYTLDVVVKEIFGFNEFIGQVECIHGDIEGEWTVLSGNDIYHQLKGQCKTFKNSAIIKQ
jgi:hypothetical protein